jgi:hypothetical protein
LRFLCQKYDFCTSRLMTASSSVNSTLKRAKRRNYWSARLSMQLPDITF